MSNTRSFAQIPNYPEQEKRLKIAAIVVSIVVIGLVVMMRRVKLPVEADLSFLPAVNAIINSLTAVALLFSLYFVKTKNYLAHRNANFAALGLSVLFLGCYVAYHFTTQEVVYGDANHDGVLSELERAAVAGIRPYYLLILFSHIALAGLILPFILYTAIHALTGKYKAHKKLARYVWPLWFYVAVTGPVVYLMLSKYYV